MAGSSNTQMYMLNNYGNYQQQPEQQQTQTSGAADILPILGWFSLGGAQAQMGAEHFGTYMVPEVFTMPYTYGAPSGTIGTVSGQYAGAASKKTMAQRKEYTTAGKVVKTIGGLLAGFAGDTAGAMEGFSWMDSNPDRERAQMYNQWAGSQGQYLGKEGIIIKPSKRGSFTAWCKKQGFGGVTSECKSAGKNSQSPAIRKKATFATNAAKWKHK